MSHIPLGSYGMLDAMFAVCRQAFQFLWDMKNNVPTQASSAEAQQQQNLLARLFSKKPQEPFRPPASDMRALNGLESVLTKAGVFK